MRVCECMCVRACVWVCVRMCACVNLRRKGRNNTSGQTCQVFVAAWYSWNVFHVYIMTINYCQIWRVREREGCESGARTETETGIERERETDT